MIRNRASTVSRLTGPPPFTCRVHPAGECTPKPYRARLNKHVDDVNAVSNITEQSFFDHARQGFPDLVFADPLSFRKFDGTYTEMREWVARLLSVVHDHFADAMALHSGQPHQVQAELGRFGLDLSPESPNTRSKPGS
ncbi:hypothetical protein PUR34_33145 [Streptomyces sp. JV185]|uniref:hypothetical protein n=1 Tax=Streptomyces sp. JV185 TaxID=858638 RepID=UPI002E762445|nr:hypothetical protein [Streptomyces sp. JV185]MEE1772878.1 hypothetical protein [Streptomyces sp. JV185]